MVIVGCSLAVIEASAAQYVDIHSHLDGAVNLGLDDFNGAADVAIASMNAAGVLTTIVMPPPISTQPFQVSSIFECDEMSSVLSRYPGRFAFMCGGGSLNIMIQQSVTGVAVIGTETFKTRARELAQTQGFVGFGETTALHFCLDEESHVYLAAPPDHYLFKALVDVASEENVPLDFHMEAVFVDTTTPSSVLAVCPSKNPATISANMTQFENLLTYANSKNPAVKIIWDHLGMDYTRQKTPTVVDDLLDRYSNLYISVNNYSNGRLTTSSGSILPGWLTVFEEHPDRFMMGADQFFITPLTSSHSFPSVFDGTWSMFSQLSPSLQDKFSYQNAAAIFNINLPSTNLSSPKAYPNPLLPNRGHQKMTMSNLPASCALKIYTVVGELVRELTADPSGTASWDAKNSSGRSVASGVYFVSAEASSGEKTVFKVAVQR